MVLSDEEIFALAESDGIINPFSDGVNDFSTPGRLDGYVYPCRRQKGKIPWGLSSFGYDFRVKPIWKLFPVSPSVVVDPKNMPQDMFITVEADWIDIPPNSLVLAETVEYFRIPDNMCGIIATKSTLARSGFCLNTTFAEPGWEGTLTIEISNQCRCQARFYANEGAGQIHFIRGARPWATYREKNGIYQRQTGISFPSVQ